ncbi:hypothetical protein ACFOUV_00940 [Oceanobacillus longus]|uniref:DUF1292 domain-containing protein n=1 Tax=Oceanobacillus longus TaxID=930120 RepID=A0ABV8GU99_9BACI
MSKVFSTGPLENANGPLTTASFVMVKVLNNDTDDETEAHIKVFALNGDKIEIGDETLEVEPESSDFTSFDVSNAVEYEVQIELEEETDDVLVSVFGKNVDNELIAAHRVLQSELKKIDELTD